MEHDAPPRLRGILETAVYVADLERAKQWYQELFRLDVLVEDERMCALAVGEGDVFLLFVQGGTTEPVDTPGGQIPAHDARGRIHFAFTVDVADLPQWERRVSEAGIEIESRVEWNPNARSVYFRDPDGHLVELATPGLWRAVQ